MSKNATDQKTEKQPVELKEEDLDQAQGAGIPIGPLSRGKKADEIIVVDEDGISGPSDQFPGKK